MNNLAIITLGFIFILVTDFQRYYTIVLTSDNLTATASTFSFFVAGHTYGQPSVNNIGLHPNFQDKFDLINNDKTMAFGILTGDIVYSPSEKDWNEVDAVLAKLKVKTYFAVGNHDVSLQKPHRELFERRYGKTYFRFKYNNNLFIVLDPNIDSWNISGEQLDFLKRNLKSCSKINNIFVFFHQVLWKRSDNVFRNVKVNNTEKITTDSINFWKEVIPLFEDLDQDVYFFAGDVGAFPNGNGYHYYEVGNLHFIASGMGGGKRDNFIIVVVEDSKKVIFRLISLSSANINALGKLKDYKLP